MTFEEKTSSRVKKAQIVLFDRVTATNLMMIQNKCYHCLAPDVIDVDCDGDGEVDVELELELDVDGDCGTC